MHMEIIRFVVVILLVMVAPANSAAVRHSTTDSDTALSVSTNNPGDVSLRVASAVAKFLSVLPIKDHLVSALSVPVARAYDAMRPGLKAVGIAYLAYQALTYVLPIAMGGWSSGRQDSAAQEKGNSKSLSEAIGELGVSAMAQSLQAWNFTPKSTEILSTWELECKRRATCELGRALAQKAPYLAWIFGYFGPKFPIIGYYADAFSEGTSSPDCSRLYQECPYLRPSSES